MTGAFRLLERDDGIALLEMDLPGSRVNTLSMLVLDELGEVITRLQGRSDLRGLLFRSAKPGQFIAGADLKELARLPNATPEQVAGMLLRGHEVFSAVGRLPFPCVALVEGPCLGGGTELILSFDGRIADDPPRTEIGLPEVKIGIIPGWGGTQRLPRLIGVPNALELILTGESVSPQRAAAMGLLFDAVPSDRLVGEGANLIEYLREGELWKEERRRHAQPVRLTPDAGTFAFAVAEAMTRQKTKGHYPAPLAALEAVREGCALPLEEGLKVEQSKVERLIGSPIASHLIALFFERQRLSRDPGVASPTAPRTVERAGVLGAGLMGSGIATALARRGIPAVMIDIDDGRLAAGLARAREVIDSRMRIGRATPNDLFDLLARLSTSTDTSRFADCDIVVEAIVENEDAKAAAFRALSEQLASDAILASNTSTISITRLASATDRADRFVGLHFFNPVDRMELVEVIRGDRTSDETVATAVALAHRIKKTPIVVKDCAGFLVNRILFPYLTESVLLLQEGASMDAIDSAATAFGMPMGPILLYDVVGIDTACFAGAVVQRAYPDRTVPLPLLSDMVSAGRLGQKSGAGFRKYDGKRNKGSADRSFAPLLRKHQSAQRDISRDEITDRLFLPMLLEATRVVEESIVREPGDVDMGLILGIGFPPHRGGILRWADSVGAAEIVRQLDRYVDMGARFAPSAVLLDHAKGQAMFYPSRRKA